MMDEVLWGKTASNHRSSFSLVGSRPALGLAEKGEIRCQSGFDHALFEVVIGRQRGYLRGLSAGCMRFAFPSANMAITESPGESSIPLSLRSQS
jgi:hypothetical protein